MKEQVSTKKQISDFFYEKFIAPFTEVNKPYKNICNIETLNYITEALLYQQWCGRYDKSSVKEHMSDKPDIKKSGQGFDWKKLVHDILYPTSIIIDAPLTSLIFLINFSKYHLTKAIEENDNCILNTGCYFAQGSLWVMRGLCSLVITVNNIPDALIVTPVLKGITALTCHCINSCKTPIIDDVLEENLEDSENDTEIILSSSKKSVIATVLKENTPPLEGIITAAVDPEIIYSSNPNQLNNEPELLGKNNIVDDMTEFLHGE
ncbi:MAG: hypothetical protein HRU35_06355 [Rickettsiaceae bacterium]|nr:hypothetical protein [Rickettsiaceae bacterium]